MKKVKKAKTKKALAKSRPSKKRATSKKGSYEMKISRLTIDKLGVRLYDKVSAVLAELIANSYDADAKEVKVFAPMGHLLARKENKKIIDEGYEIVVQDDGHGMEPAEINPFFLKVGGERRRDPNRGNKSRRFKRKVMGRKGIGKLAPFGICKRIEVISAGGKRIKGEGKNGKIINGYKTAHFILEKEKIDFDTDDSYFPKTGEDDGIIVSRPGTRVILSHFTRRRVPDIKELGRQLAQRFGIAQTNWKIRLFDNNSDQSNSSSEVGDFDVPLMPGTKINFRKKGNSFIAVNTENQIIPELEAGFYYEGEFFPVFGWVGFAEKSYKDDLMAGIRIYSRGKIAGQTSLFNRTSGFEGEFTARSYITGALHIDWIDEDEDLIQTDRRDILWSEEIGQQFEEWGKKVVTLVAKMSRDPARKKAVDEFRKKTNYQERIKKEFPGGENQEIRKNAQEITKFLAQGISMDDLKDTQYLDSIVETSISFAPHVTLDKQLKAAADSKDSPGEVFVELLKTAQLAEIFAFGRIANDRVRVIGNIEKRKKKKSNESEFQEMIATSPWLIDPQWTPISQNQTFETTRKLLEEEISKRLGKEFVLFDFNNPKKRADFILMAQEGALQLVEIKKPGHQLQNEEMERIHNYYEIMQEFLEKSERSEIFNAFKEGFRITLVCDEQKLSKEWLTVYRSLKKEGTLIHIDWDTFILRTKKMHEDFLALSEQRKRNAN